MLRLRVVLINKLLYLVFRTMSMFATILKVLLQSTLFVIFLCYFGLPALERYNQMKVLTVSTKKSTDGIADASFTIVAMHPDDFRSWRGLEEVNNSSFGNVIMGACRSLHGDAIVDCINNKTYGKEDVVEDVLLGFYSRESLLEDKHWSVDFTLPTYGRTYTVHMPRKLRTNYETDQLMLEFDENLVYKIFIHERSFFILNENYYGLPMAIISVFPKSDPKLYYQLVLTEHEELNVPSDPCNTDPSYNFKACVKESLSKQVGCRIKWDEISDQSRPLCSSLEQYR